MNLRKDHKRKKRGARDLTTPWPPIKKNRGKKKWNSQVSSDEDGSRVSRGTRGPATRGSLPLRGWTCRAGGIEGVSSKRGVPCEEE